MLSLTVTPKFVWVVRGDENICHLCTVKNFFYTPACGEAFDYSEGDEVENPPDAYKCPCCIKPV